MADLTTALTLLLKADVPTAALAGDRVFGGELPPGMTASMPAFALVAALSGGVSMTAGSLVPADTVRFDLKAYGPTPAQAMALLSTAALALRQAPRGVRGGMLIHWINPAGGPLPMRDDFAWPFAWQPFQVLHALQPVTGGP